MIYLVGNILLADVKYLLLKLKSSFFIGLGNYHTNIKNRGPLKCLRKHSKELKFR